MEFLVMPQFTGSLIECYSAGGCPNLSSCTCYMGTYCDSNGPSICGCKDTNFCGCQGAMDCSCNNTHSVPCTVRVCVERGCADKSSILSNG